MINQNKSVQNWLKSVQFQSVLLLDIYEMQIS